MKSYSKILVSLLFILCPSFVFSQNKNSLEKEKTENKNKIEYTRTLLEKTSSQKASSLARINLLNEAIKSREALIQNYEKEIQNLEEDIAKTTNAIDRNEKEIADLKSDYARIIKNSYRNIENDFLWMYILSSDDINQAYQRFKYIRYLNDYRRGSIASINSLNDSLQMKKERLITQMKERLLSVKNLGQERKNLESDKEARDRTLRELKKQENKLMAELRKMEEVERKIELEIRRLIAAEAKKASNEKRTERLTPAEKLISDKFVLNKGRLPWPTETGIITGRFGEHDHPVLRGIKIPSNGIDISTSDGAYVRSAFDGEVTRVIAILGANYTVIIKHGDYRTVYQNLIDVRVKAGDVVKTKEILGKVYTNEDNLSKVHFEVWKNTEPVNPEVWLSK